MVLGHDHLRAAATAALEQTSVDEAAETIVRARSYRVAGDPLVEPTRRTETYRHPHVRLSPTVRRLFARSLPYLRASIEDVRAGVIAVVRAYGQIKRSDYVEMFDVTPVHAGQMLAKLASCEAGRLLQPGLAHNRGRNAHYVAGPGFP
jgi:hypothetical protein